MTNNVLIRPANREDAPDITNLTIELGYNADVKSTISYLSALEMSANDVVFVAVLSQQTIGWIQVSYKISLESGAFCEIMGLVVNHEKRGIGVGSKLVDSAIKWSDEKKCEKLRVRSNILRNDAHAFYRHLKFNNNKTQLVFEKKLV